MAPRAAAQARQTTTPAAGPTTTDDLPADRRAALPPGDGELDAPDDNEEIEQTLEAFRQLSGEGQDIAPRVAIEPDPADPDYEQPVPGEEDGISFPQEVVPPGTTAQPTVEATPVAPVAPAAEPVEQQPTAAPSTVAPQAPAPAESRPEAIFAEMAQGLQQHEAVFRDRLAAEAYALTDKDIDELNTDPKSAFAKMAARVHVNAVSSVMRTMAQQMPVVVMGMLKAVKANDEAQDRFWSAYPNLNKNDPQHKQMVSNIARNVRTLNPNMSEADMVRYTGAQALVMLGLPQVAPAAQQQRPRAPSMPGRQVRQTATPYAPAGAKTTGGQAPNGQANRNQWDLMSSLIEMDNRGVFDPRS